MALLEISDLEKASPIFRGKMGNAFARWAMHAFALDDVCKVYDEAAIYEGADFAKAVLKNTGTDYKVGGQDCLKELPGSNFLTISNHIYGSVDGLILADYFGHHFPDYKIMVNKTLSILKAFGPSFITVIPTGQTRTAATKESINGVMQSFKHLKKGNSMGFFPAGAMSNLNLKSGEILDREWQEPVIRLIKKARVPIVPVRFFDHHRMLFYYLGLINWRLRLLMLPRETINKRGKEVRVGIGHVITVEEQDKYTDIKEYSDFLRKAVYGVTMPEDLVRRSEMDF